MERPRWRLLTPSWERVSRRTSVEALLWSSGVRDRSAPGASPTTVTRSTTEPVRWSGAPAGISPATPSFMLGLLCVRHAGAAGSCRNRQHPEEPARDYHRYPGDRHRRDNDADVPAGICRMGRRAALMGTDGYGKKGRRFSSSPRWSHGRNAMCCSTRRIRISAGSSAPRPSPSSGTGDCSVGRS